MKFPIAEVTWIDAGAYNGWTNVETAINTANGFPSISAGYLLRNDKKIVVLALTHDTHEKVSSVIEIPKKYVTNLKILRKGKK